MAATGPLVRKLVRGAEGAETALKAGRQEARSISQGQTIADFKRGLNVSMDEYDQVAGQLDAADEIITPDTVRREIEQAAQQEKEVIRQSKISSPSETFELEHQTRTPEEFAVRMRQQMRDPDYAANSIGSVNNVPQIKEAAETHIKIRDSVLGNLRKNTRWAKRTSEWSEASPYEGDVLFHLDRITDPRNPDSFIQFEQPREMGLHAGTNSAAEGVIGFGGLNNAVKMGDEINEVIDIVSSVMEVDSTKLHAQFGAAVNAHYTAKFGGGVSEVNLWGDLEEILADFADATGFGQDEVKTLIKDIKNQPTPNTFPMLFKGKNGLMLQDEGNFGPVGVAGQLETIFNTSEDFAEIQAALQAGDKTQRTKALQTFIESKGYDHIVYHNTVEDKGSVSIINWNPELQKSPWDGEFTRDDSVEQAKAASAWVLGMLGLGAAGGQIRNTEPEA